MDEFDDELEPTADGAATSAVDPTLAMIVKAVNTNKNDETAQIGLCVHGTTVFGTLIGVYSLYEKMLGLDQERADRDVEDIRRILADAEALFQAEAAAGLAAPPKFINLRDATIVEGTCHLRVPYWRGRLDAVDAWFPGGLSD